MARQSRREHVDALIQASADYIQSQLREAFVESLKQQFAAEAVNKGMSDEELDTAARFVVAMAERELLRDIEAGIGEPIPGAPLWGRPSESVG